MAVRLKWPATMSATLQTAIEDTLKHWRNLDKARPGGPHLPPYGLQHRVRVLYPDIQCLQDGEELADPDDRVLSHMHNPLDPLVEDEEVVKNACRSSMEDNHFSSYYRATEFTTAEEFYDAWNQADPEAALDALIHAPGSSLLCFLPYRKIGGDGIIRIRLTTQVAVETTDSPVLHNHTNTLFDYPLLDVFNWLRDPSRATKWAWVGDLMELVWGQSQRAIRHRILLLESRKFQFIDRNSPEAWVREKQNFDNAVQARYRFRMRRWPPYATIWEYRKTHYSDIPNQLERFCAICWRPFGPYEQPILQEPYAYPCNRNHYICEECLVLTCRVTGPGSDVAKCLMDDTPCYTREEQDYLKYGEFHGVFAPPVPSRFVAWENYERSWADLDRRGRGTTATADAGAAGAATEDGGGGGTVVVVPNGEIMITDPHMVVYIFMDIIQQDDRYPELCYQFRPILYPEMAHIVEAFCDAIFLSRGLKCSVADAVSMFQNHIEYSLMEQLTYQHHRTAPDGGTSLLDGRAEILCGPDFHTNHLVNGRIQNLTPETCKRLHLYRDNLFQWIEKCLYRTLEFCRLRRCRLPEDDGHCVGLLPGSSRHNDELQQQQADEQQLQEELQHQQQHSTGYVSLSSVERAREAQKEIERARLWKSRHHFHGERKFYHDGVFERYFDWNTNDWVDPPHHVKFDPDGNEEFKGYTVWKDGKPWP